VGRTGNADGFSFIPAPGRQASGYISSRINGRLQVMPRDVATLVPRTLEPALFDINTLLEEQGDDTATADISLIWQQGPRTPHSGMPDVTRGRKVLRSIRAEALKLPKAKAKDFGAALVAAGDDSGALPRKVWLDRQVKVTVDANMRQVGAPALWDTGGDGSGSTIAVLDTGVDGTHPDLQGKVIASENFTDSSDALDHHGHGTHVASIAAGSGGASGGERRGVAHGARILSAKVLGDDGFGPFSAVIAGVEWAAAQGADVANLSLGSDGDSDGTDPLSLAVDAATRDTGTLFVAAAGNRAAPGTIGTPGAAAEALTVGAVDVNDSLAHFSSRGPRLGGGVKPEITAPGVDIMAAFTTVGGAPGQTPYIPLSGTSMATPHVAGGAAVLAQRHPSWTPDQLKAALMGTAQEQPGAGVYEQGGGRMFLPDADAATLLAAQPAVDFGLLPYPQSDTPNSRSVSWTNTGPVGVTVDLSVRAPGLPAGTASVTPATVTVAPGATATAAVAIQAGSDGPAPGTYGGEVVADVRGGGSSGVPFAFEKEPKRFNLRVRPLDRDGNATTQAFVSVWNTEDMSVFNIAGAALDATGVATLRVPPGRYHAEAVIDAFDYDNGTSDGRWIVQPDIDVQASTDVVLDARATRPAQFTVAGSPTVQSHVQWQERREDALGGVTTVSIGSFGPLHTLAATPTPPVSTGKLDTYVNGRAAAPSLRFVDVSGAPALPVFGSSAFLGDRRLQVVDVGEGTAADFTPARLRGALAVVTRRGHPPTATLFAAQRAGVALVALANGTDTSWQTFLEAEATTPAVTVTSSTGAALVAAKTVRVVGAAVADPTYDVVYRTTGRFPESNVHTLSAVDVARMTRVGSAVAALPGAPAPPIHGLGRAPVVDGFDVAAAVLVAMPAGVRRTEYVQPGRWRSTAYRTDESAFLALEGPVVTEPVGGKRSETWFGAPWRPLTRQVNQFGEFEAAFRDGAGLFMGLPPLADAHGHVEASLSFGGVNTTYTVRRGGRLVGTASGPFGFVPLEPGAANLEIGYDVDAGTLMPSQGRSQTVWRLRSAPPDTNTHPIHLLEPDLQLPVDLRGALTGSSAGLVVRRPFGAAVALRKVTVQVSTNGGTTWRNATTSITGPATAAVTLPAIAKDAPVAVRVEATDANGESVTQTLFAATVGSAG
jgi:subtilisin family serine protease